MKKGLLIALIVLVLLSVGVLFALKQLDLPWGEGISTTSPELCNHQWNEGVLTNARECGDGAIVKFTCTSCGETKEESVTNHNLIRANTVLPTCTGMGYTEYHCSRCDALCVSDFVNAHGHNYNTDVVVKEATCTASGTSEKVCGNCDETYLYSKNATGHSYILISDEETSSTYECEHCLTSVTVNDGETLEEFVGNDELFDVPPTFSFDILSSENEAFIRENLVILDNYYNDSEYENNPNAIKEFALVSKGNNIWTVTATSNYDYDTTYIAKLQNGLSFAEHKGETLTFTVTEDPNHENTYEYTGDIVFLQALENANPGYYPYNVVSSNESEYLYLTLNKIDGLTKDMIICIGNVTSKEQLASSIGYHFGKIDAFYPLADGSWMVTLAEPDITEVFDELDVAYDGTIDFSEADIDTEQLEAELTDVLFSNEDFIKFLSVVNVSANQYFTDNNYSTEELADTKGFMDKIKINPKFKVSEDGKSIIASVNGSLNIPIKSGKKEIGSFNVAFTVGLKSAFELDIDYDIKENIFGEEKIDKFDVRVTQTDTFDFNFSVSIDIHESLEEYKYVQNTDTGKIHRTGCVHLSSIKDNSKLKGLSAETAEQYLSTTPSLGCKHCQPVTGFNSDLIVLNTNSKVIHTYGCANLTNIADKNKKLSSEKSSYWMAQGYTCCQLCHPDNREEIEYEAIYVKTLQYGDWQQVATDMTQWAKDSGIAERSKKGVTITKIDFPIYGPIVITLELDIVLTLDIEATFEYVYSYEQVNTYGIRKEGNKIKPYSNNVSKTTLENHCSVMGKIEVRAGVLVDVSINIAGFSKYVGAGITAEVGAYAEISGILSWSGTNDSDYMAAYFAVGIYLDVNAYYKILWWDGEVDVFNKKFPLLTMGYERAYFGYTTYLDELAITNSFDIAEEDLLKVKYFDLTTMTTKTDELSVFGGTKYKVNITFADGRYCEIKNGCIVPKEDAPNEFTDVMVITVTCDAKWASFKKGNYVYYLGTYEIPFTFNWDQLPEQLEFTLNDNGKSYSVTGIGTYKDRKLEIPATYNGKPVTAIGDDAFAYCDFISNVKIPNSITSIGASAFFDCTSLEIVIVDADSKLKSIGDMAFANCFGLKFVDLPEGLTEVGASAFRYCISLTSVIIPQSIKTLSDRMFSNCHNLSKVTIAGNNLEIISHNAFSKCASLSSFRIPKSVTYIAPDAFYSLHYYRVSLKQITFDGTQTQWDAIDKEGWDQYFESYTVHCADGIIEVNGGDSFDNYLDTFEFTLNNDGNGYTVTKCTFSGLSVLIPPAYNGKPVTAIGAGAFADRDSWITLQIPNTVKNIGSQAIAPNLRAIVYEGTLAQWKAISKEIGWDQSVTEFKIYCSDGILKKEISDDTNNASKGLEFALNDDGESYSVTDIGTCTDTEIIIPSTYNGKPVTAIGDYAFICWTDYNFTSITIPDSVTSIGDAAFHGCSSLTSITIPNSVTSIGEEAFGWCPSLTSVTIPDSVTSIGKMVVAGCNSLNSITVASKNPIYYSAGNCIIERESKILIQGCQNSIIPQDIIAIGDYAFADCWNLASITIPDSVTSIGNFAFDYCGSLTSITIPNSVTSIGEGAFNSCWSLTSITFEGTVEQWNAIEKGSLWNYGVPVVVCSDGIVKLK